MSFFAQGPVRSEDVDTVLGRARHRSTVVMAVVGLGYTVLALRAVPLMLMPDDRLQAQAATQFQEAKEVRAPRGDILARDGTVLATTVRMPGLHADPSHIPQGRIDEISLELSRLIPVEADVIAEQLSRSHRQDVLLSEQISPDAIAPIEALDRALNEDMEEKKNLFWSPEEPVRYYPGRELGAQVLGIVARNGTGVEGIESRLDSDLKGSTFRFLQERDRRGRSISTELETRSRAHAGDSVTTTLDPYVQRAAEDALDELVERSEPLSATAVVMDVRTGEILAIANRPTTNPNDRAGRDSAKMRNHAVADAHEPGSVLKPFVVALAVEDGLVSPESLIDCEGGRFSIGRTTIRDDHAHGVVTVSEVVKYSSNIGTAKLAFELGAERVIGGLKDFGFTRYTGVPLPAEVPGFLRDPATIKPIELATTAFGQGMTATALQLASGLQTLGNGGVRMQPLLVTRIEDRHGQLEFSARPEELGRPISQLTAEQTVQMMATVFEDGGTGQRIRIPGYTAAGKTGTAQKVVDGRYSPTARVASFIAVAPATDPRIAIVVMADTPTKGSRYGGTVSGPAFQLIAERTLRYLGVAPDRLDEDPLPAVQAEETLSLPPVAELSWTESGELRIPDFSGMSMRDVLVAVDGSGLSLAVRGSGSASSQSPPPGSPLRPGDRLEVRFD